LGAFSEEGVVEAGERVEQDRGADEVVVLVVLVDKGCRYD
jgi:hypothetical protein